MQVVKSSGTLVNPLTECLEILKLGLLQIEEVVGLFVDRNGKEVRVDLRAQLRYGDSNEMVVRAAELFLNKTNKEVCESVRQAIVGKLNTMLGALDAKDAIASCEMIDQKSRESVSREIAAMGLEFVSFVVRPMEAGMNAEREERLT